MNFHRHLLALAVGALALTVASPAQSATSVKPAKTIQLSRVAGTATPVDGGVRVTTSFTAKNRTGARQGATAVWVFLTNADHTYKLGAETIPALPAGADARVKVDATTPPRTARGSYAVRVCLTPRPSGPCATSKKTNVDVGTAELAADPAEVAFPDTAMGAGSDPAPVTITNVGHSRTDGALALDVYGPDAADFQVAAGTCDAWLAPGAACTAQLTFAPAGGRGAPGDRTAYLRVAGGPLDSTDVTLSGAATAPDSPVTIVPGDHDYGAVPVGSTATFTYRLTNNTDDDLPLTAGGLSDYTSFVFDYVDGENTCLSNVIPAHDYCTFSVAFAPVAAGPATTIAEFGSGAYLGTATLTGTGTMVPVRPAPRPRAGGYALR